ncbi:hypothetical protein FPQ18DRAFT_415018 [Pyronema domesticum]|uniref:Uncharacterized protein n=1 Tax=Pyronema omphalodes (strain CBS 100304) TaxID=1076935 RepID=U4LNL1_PYROM|nr:hypothetical protein FPQ18DRAFT_415018 [Pyronema domesticum]CCX33533.1 Protein of unknown function [Pyronema omphalodes CBS 100304]
MSTGSNSSNSSNTSNTSNNSNSSDFSDSSDSPSSPDEQEDLDALLEDCETEQELHLPRLLRPYHNLRLLPPSAHSPHWVTLAIAPSSPNPFASQAPDPSMSFSSAAASQASVFAALGTGFSDFAHSMDGVIEPPMNLSPPRSTRTRMITKRWEWMIGRT